MKRVVSLCVLWLVMLAASHVESKENQPNQEAIRVFLDCSDCDRDHMLREVAFVDYVRDRTLAQVHVLITDRRGGSGSEYTFEFIGLEQFTGLDDRVVYVASETDTADEVRARYTAIFRLGLMRYVARMPLAGRLDVSLAEGLEPVSAQPEDDPWNFWVVRLGGTGDISGEEQSSTRALSGFMSLSRTTEAWKVKFAANGRYDESRFDLEGDRSVLSSTRSLAADTLVVRSLGNHWGVGDLTP